MVLAALVVTIALTDPIIRMLHDMTGSERAADGVAGCRTVWVPRSRPWGIMILNGGAVVGAPESCGRYCC
jgi:hypothetical protein